MLRFQPLRLSRTSNAVLEMLRTAAGCMVMGVSAYLRLPLAAPGAQSLVCAFVKMLVCMCRKLRELASKKAA